MSNPQKRILLLSPRTNIIVIAAVLISAGIIPPILINYTNIDREVVSALRTILYIILGIMLGGTVLQYLFLYLEQKSSNEHNNSEQELLSSISNIISKQIAELKDEIEDKESIKYDSIQKLQALNKSIKSKSELYRVVELFSDLYVKFGEYPLMKLFTDEESAKALPNINYEFLSEVDHKIYEMKEISSQTVLNQIKNLVEQIKTEYLSLASEVVVIELLARSLEDFSNLYIAFSRREEETDLYVSHLVIFRKSYQIHQNFEKLNWLDNFLKKDLADNTVTKQNESQFVLVLYSIKNYKDLLTRLITIESLYTELCSLLKISESEYPLRIRKVKTGSVIIDLIGHVLVIGCIVWFIKEGIKFIYRNYTTEGKISSIPKQLEVADSILQFTEKLGKAGIDITKNREDIRNAAGQIIQNLNTLLSEQPKIKINNEEIYVGNDYEKQFLQDSKEYLLNENESIKRLKD